MDISITGPSLASACFVANISHYALRMSPIPQYRVNDLMPVATVANIQMRAVKVEVEKGSI